MAEGQIVLHEGQSDIFYDLFCQNAISHAVAICCRGFGKSFLAAAAAVAAIDELIMLPAHVPNKVVVIIAPTYSQVTDVYYNLLYYGFGLGEIAIKASKDTGRFEFANNVELKLVSYEAVQRLRGTGIYFLVCDETRDWVGQGGFQDAWDSILLPCMTTRWSPKHAREYGAPHAARSLTISTPKGYDFLYEMSRKCELNPEYKSYQFDYTKAPRLDQDEVLKIKATTDPISFAREYGASFKSSGATIFYCFDRNVHVRADLPEPIRGTVDCMGEVINVGIDFNVLKQASSAFVIRGREVHYINEFEGAADTETLAISIKAKYWPNWNNPQSPEYRKKICHIRVFPDPSGRSRKTSAVVGTTDFTILQSHGFEVLAHNAHPSIVDSVACVNRLLKTADGKVSMYFHPRCTGLIKSMERTSWVDKNPDTATIDKSKGEEHFTDGVRYPMEYLYPIKSSTKTSARGFGF